MATGFSTEYPQRGIAVTTWPSVAVGEQGLPASCTRWRDKTVQVSGTFGAAGSITLEGSNDGITWNTLHGGQGDATFLASGIELISENPLMMRPSVTGGDGTTGIKVVIVGGKDDI